MSSAETSTMSTVIIRLVYSDPLCSHIKYDVKPGCIAGCYLLSSLFIASGCGGPKSLTGAGGTVSSMGYHGSYDNKARCQWDIKVSLGKLVYFHFHNFSLEESQLCINDKVSLRDRIGSLGR